MRYEILEMAHTHCQQCDDLAAYQGSKSVSLHSRNPNTYGRRSSAQLREHRVVIHVS